jgi:tripartite-type tricarboxylate transporter receptor subunit TctC
LPTLAEAGLPEYEAGSWYGILAPAGTPREVIERLHGAIVRALKQPDVSKRLAAEGAELIGSTPDEFAAHIKAEIARVGKVVRAAGIRIE